MSPRQPERRLATAGLKNSAPGRINRVTIRSSPVAAIRKRGNVPGPARDDSFEAVVLPHLDAAYNLARWLVRDPAAAEDVVQEAMLRALSYFSSFRGVNARAWLLQIVRNAAYSARERDRGASLVPIGPNGDDAAIAEDSLVSE